MGNGLATTRLRGRARRLLLALLVALTSIGSTGVATSLASNAGGAQKSRPASFGDCKNENAGLHNGYVCEEEEELPG
jgi:hypothetical protein